MQPLTDLKVIRHYGPNDVDAIYDGQYIGSFKTRQEAQQALDDHAMRLIEDGLVDTPLATLDAPVLQPCISCGAVQERASCDQCVEWGDEPDPNAPELNETTLEQLHERDGFSPPTPVYSFTRPQLTKALDGAIEMFLEEMESRQLAADEVIQGLDADRELAAFDPTERLRLQLPNDTPNAGAAIARHWMRRRASFLTALRQLDRDVWPILAEAYCAWMNAGGTRLRAEHVLTVWREMIDADIALPPRAA